MMPSQRTLLLLLSAVYSITAQEGEAQGDVCAARAEPSEEPYTEMCYLVRKNANFKDVHYSPPAAFAHNHITYELVAMYKLGANASVLNRCYERASKEIAPAVPSAHYISDANWLEHIGDNSRGLTPTVSVHYADYLEFFRRKIRQQGMTNIVQWALPHLADGLSGDLLHPVIQLGYCYEVIDTDICAEGLAWMAVGFTPLGEANPSPKYTDIRQAMADIHQDPRLPSVVTVPQLSKSFPRIMAEYDLQMPDNPTPDQVAKIAKDISFAVLDFFAVDGYRSFFVVHLCTSARAVHQILAHVDPPTQAQVLRRFWSTALYFFVEYGRPQLQIPRVDEGALPSWSALAATTIPHLDVHLAKMVYLARENRKEWGPSADRYTLMADSVVARFEAGNEWEYGGRVGPSFTKQSGLQAMAAGLSLSAAVRFPWLASAFAGLLMVTGGVVGGSWRMRAKRADELNTALLDGA